MFFQTHKHNRNIVVTTIYTFNGYKKKINSLGTKTSCLNFQSEPILNFEKIFMFCN